VRSRRTKPTRSSSNRFCARPGSIPKRTSTSYTAAVRTSASPPSSAARCKPQDKKAAERGYNALAFTPDLYKFLQLSITTVRRDWAQQHPDVLRRYLRSQADASRWLNDRRNKDAALRILEKATNITQDEASAAYDAYVVRVHDFPNNYCVMRPGMEAILTMMHDLGQTSSTPADVGKYIDAEWCPK
jgi:ABC-type nitrate/sulfonate/bicarbonate transport system substrate-binding protein